MCVCEGGGRLCSLLVSLFMSIFSISVSSPVGICINGLWRRQQVADLPHTETDEKQQTSQVKSTCVCVIYMYICLVQNVGYRKEHFYGYLWQSHSHILFLMLSQENKNIYVSFKIQQ